MGGTSILVTIELPKDDLPISDQAEEHGERGASVLNDASVFVRRLDSH